MVGKGAQIAAGAVVEEDARVQPGEESHDRVPPAGMATVDSAGMLDDMPGQPHQLEDALRRVESAGIERLDAPGGLVVCGMGGSAIGGDLASCAIGDRARRLIITSRDYDPPSWLSEDAAVLCSSYSGDTEETLAATAPRASAAPAGS